MFYSHNQNMPMIICNVYFCFQIRERCLSRTHSSSIIIDPQLVSLVATCFYTSVSLLRLVEMIVHLCPEVLTDWSRPSAELLLCRLLQVGIISPFDQIL